MDTESTICFKLLISSMVWDVFQTTALGGLILLALLLKHLLNIITCILLSTFGTQNGFACSVELMVGKRRGT